MAMKSWKLWLFGCTTVIILTVVALCSALWNNISTEWAVQADAAQFALDHSPLNHITEHDVFTAAGAQEVFSGTDAFNRPWYAFVYGSPFQVQYVDAANLRTKDEIIKDATARHMNPTTVHIGYLDTDQQATFHTQDPVVWEVIGRSSTNETTYSYFDAKTGELLPNVYTVSK